MISEYKGYRTDILYNREDHVFYGKIEDTEDLVSYESETPQGAVVEFRKAVDDYIKTKEEIEKV